MYNFQRYQPKELALAYMSSKSHDYSPSEFLQQLKNTERAFDQMLKTGQVQNHELLVKEF